MSSRLQRNHHEFMQLAKELNETQDPNEATKLGRRLAQLNAEYFSIFENNSVKIGSLQDIPQVGSPLIALRSLQTKRNDGGLPT